MDHDADAWRLRLVELCDSIRDRARTAMAAQLEASGRGELARPQRSGAGDVSYAVDLETEEVVSRWFEQSAARAPLSLLTEDTGWRHAGPRASGGHKELAGFDHGGPRITIDPVDGTRNLMADLRSAWTVVGLAPAGASQPRLADIDLGVVAEIPTSGANLARRFWAHAGKACYAQRVDVGARSDEPAQVLAPSNDDRPDHGYFSFFRYLPNQRSTIGDIEARFFDRLEQAEGADVRTCYDDQYISSGGQLALLTLGTYRMVADLRGWLAERTGTATITCKPYDCAGAILCARAAGAVITAPDGGAIDFPIDCTSPVSFVGWVNEPTRLRLAPHLDAAIAAAAV